MSSNDSFFNRNFATPIGKSEIIIEVNGVGYLLMLPQS